MSKVKDLFKIGIPNQKEMENTISHIRYRIKSAHDASIYNSRFRIKDKTTIVNTKKIEKNSHIQTNKKPIKEIISKLPCTSTKIRIIFFGSYFCMAKRKVVWTDNEAGNVSHPSAILSVWYAPSALACYS